jgi:hypothetical protein
MKVFEMQANASWLRSLICRWRSAFQSLIMHFIRAPTLFCAYQPLLCAPAFNNNKKKKERKKKERKKKQGK